MSYYHSNYKIRKNIISSDSKEESKSNKIEQITQNIYSYQKDQNLIQNKVFQNIQQKKYNNNIQNKNERNNIEISYNKKNYTSKSRDINNAKNINLNKSNLARNKNLVLDSEFLNEKRYVKQKSNLTSENFPVKIEIEFEKINNNKLIQNDENGNFNVYFMKPDLRPKTITTTKLINHKFRVNPKYIQHMSENENEIINEDGDNPYNINNYISQEPQFKEKNSEVMPLEIIHDNYEKQFKAHLVQKLISFKLKNAENRKIPLNVASKKRREENFRNSLKHLLAKQSQPTDIKKELMYYKGYFRFWKRKCKSNLDAQKYRKKFKKDRNIRITTVIYKAEEPAIRNNLKQQNIKEKKLQFEKNEKLKQKLISNLQGKKKGINNKELNIAHNLNYNKNLITNNNGSKDKKKYKDFEGNLELEKNIAAKKRDDIYLNNCNEQPKTLNYNYIPKRENNILGNSKNIKNNNEKREEITKSKNALENGMSNKGFKVKKDNNKGIEKEGTTSLENIKENKNSNSKGELKNYQNINIVSEDSGIIGDINKKEINNKNNEFENNMNEDMNNINFNICKNNQGKSEIEQERDHIYNSLEEENMNIKDNEDFNIKKKENDNNKKWTINKYNWKLENTSKENDSLFRVSVENLNNSKVRNSQILNSQKISESQKINGNNVIEKKEQSLPQPINIQNKKRLNLKNEQQMENNDFNELEEKEIIKMGEYINPKDRLEIDSNNLYNENEEDNEEGEVEGEVEENEINMMGNNELEYNIEEGGEEEQIYENNINNEEEMNYEVEEIQNKYINDNEGNEQEYINEEEMNPEEIEEFEEVEEGGEYNNEEQYINEGEEQYIVDEENQGDYYKEGIEVDENNEGEEQYIIDEDNQGGYYDERMEGNKNNGGGFTYINEEDLQDENINYEENNDENYNENEEDK